MPSPTTLIYAYLNHNLICLHLATGEEVWRTKLPKSGSYVASLLVQDDTVIVGVNGVVHCVDAYTGQLRWTNELKGLGYGNIFLNAATPQAVAIQAASNQAAIMVAQTASTQAAITAATSS